MSPGFKVVLGIILLIAIPGFYILNKGPDTELTAAEQAKIDAQLKKIPKKDEASAAPAAGAEGAATDPWGDPVNAATDPATAGGDPMAAGTSTDYGTAEGATTATDPAAGTYEQPTDGPAPASVPATDPYQSAEPATPEPATDTSAYPESTEPAQPVNP